MSCSTMAQRAKMRLCNWKAATSWPSKSALFKMICFKAFVSKTSF